MKASSKNTMRSNFAIGLLATLMLGTASQAPAQFSKPSESTQIKLGKGAANDLRKHEKVLPDSDPRVQLLRKVAKRLLATFNDPKEKWEYSFDVIDSKQINAFALPGGPTFFYTGLLDKLNTEDELAGVLGHELTHVRKQHWAYQYRDQQKRDALMTLGALIVKPSRTVMGVAGVASTLAFDLPFSRKHESEADDGGYESMIRAGYNPQGMVDVFQMLKDTSGSGKTPEFLSDHPSDDRRIDRLRDKIAEDTRRFPPQRPINLGSKSK